VTDAASTIQVVYDRRLWLRAPAHVADLDAWAAAAAHEVVDRFDDVDPDERARSLAGMTMLARRFAAAGRDGVSERFLLTADLSLNPLVAEMHFRIGLPDHAAAEAILEFDEDLLYYDEPSAVVVDEAAGLVRVDRVAVDGRGRLTTLRRYHRRVEQVGGDIVVISDGADLKTATLARAALDTLAASIRVIGPDGQEW